MSIRTKKLSVEISSTLKGNFDRLEKQLLELSKMFDRLDRSLTRVASSQEFSNRMRQNAKSLDKSSNSAKKALSDFERLKKSLAQKSFSNFEKLEKDIDNVNRAFGNTKEGAKIALGIIKNGLQGVKDISEKINIAENLKPKGIQANIIFKPYIASLRQIKQEAEAAAAAKNRLNSISTGNRVFSALSQISSAGLSVRDNIRSNISNRALERQGNLRATNIKVTEALDSTMGGMSSSIRKEMASFYKSQQDSFVASNNRLALAMAQVSKAANAQQKDMDKQAKATERAKMALLRKTEAAYRYTASSFKVNKVLQEQTTLAQKAFRAYNQLGYALFQLQYSGLAIVSVLGIGTFTQMADQFTQFQYAIAMATSSQAEFAKGMEDVRDIARDTFQDVDQVAKTYRVFSVVAKERNLSQDNVGTLSRTVSVLGSAGGQPAEATNAALYQFSQALQSNRLGGDELRSISEQAPMLLRAIIAGINGIDYRTVTSSMQRNFLDASRDGQIDQAAIVRALMSEEVQKMANTLERSIPVTFSGVTQNLIGTFEKMAGTINSASNAARGFNNAVKLLDDVFFASSADLASEPEKYQKLVENIRNTGQVFAVLGVIIGAKFLVSLLKVGPAVLGAATAISTMAVAVAKSVGFIFRFTSMFSGMWAVLAGGVAVGITLKKALVSVFTKTNIWAALLVLFVSVLNDVIKAMNPANNILKVFVGTILLIGDAIGKAVTSINNALAPIRKIYEKGVDAVANIISGGKNVSAGREQQLAAGVGGQSGIARFFNTAGSRFDTSFKTTSPQTQGPGFGDGKGTSSTPNNIVSAGSGVSKVNQVIEQANRFVKSIRESINNLLSEDNFYSAINRDTQNYIQEFNDLESSVRNQIIKQTGKGIEQLVSEFRAANITKAVNDLRKEMNENLFGNISTFVESLAPNENIANSLESRLDFMKSLTQYGVSLSTIVAEVGTISNITDADTVFKNLLSVIPDAEIVDQLRKNYAALGKSESLRNGASANRRVRELNNEFRLLTQTAGISSRQSERVRTLAELEQQFPGQRGVLDAQQRIFDREDFIRSNPVVGALEAINEYMEKVADVAEATKTTITNALNSLEEELTNLLLGDAFDFGKIFTQIGRELTAQFSRQYIISPILNAFKNILPGIFKPQVSVGQSQSVGEMRVFAANVVLEGALSSIGNAVGTIGSGIGKVSLPRIGSGLGSIFKGGNFLSNVFGLLTSIFHSGGVAGGPAAMAMAPASMFSGARRFHGGKDADKIMRLANNEIPAILQRGEVVLNGPQQANLARNMGGSSSLSYSPTIVIQTSGNASDEENREIGKLVEETTRRTFNEMLMKERRQGGSLASVAGVFR